MRCASIKKNKCWKIIKLELTSHTIRLFIYLFHIDVVHLSLLERVGLVGSFNFLLWAFICIVTNFLAFEALNLTDVSFCRLTPITITISSVVALVSTLVVLVLVIIMTVMMLVVMVIVMVVVVVILPMLVESRTSTIIIMGTLVRQSR